MEFNSATIHPNPDDSSTKNETSESIQPATVLSGDRKRYSSTETVEEEKAESGEHLHKQNEGYADMESGDVNMEASISADDVMRAGGFGARDDISSFLPVASDSTDFEASLRDAREYEDPQKDVSRPGLGWKEDVNELNKQG